MKFLQDSIQAPYDPNWLLSTTAQSTAALVGIIGGFLLSRVVAIISEKSTLLVRLHELEARRSALAEALRPMADQVRATVGSLFTDEQLNNFVQERGNYNEADLAQKTIFLGSDSAMILECAEALSKAVKSAYSLLENSYPSPKFPPTDIDMMRSVELDLDPEIEERIYVQVAMAIERSRSLEGLLSSSDTPEFIDTLALISDVNADRHDANIGKRDEIQTNIRLLEAEMDILKSKLATLKVPKRLNQGFYVLAIFAILGIVEPLYFMTKNPVQADSNVRLLVFASFVAGFLALLVYITFALSDASIHPARTLKQRLRHNPRILWKKLLKFRLTK